MTSKLKCPEHKHSYLVVYNAQYEKEQLLGNIEITTNMPLAYADLDETRQIIANKIGFYKANIMILNIIPKRVEHKE